MPAGTNPADERRMLLAIANRPVDNNTTFIDRWRRVALPAPHASRARAPTARRCAAVADAVRPAASAAAAPVATGPSVRVARGNNVTVVPVGAR